MTANQSNNVQKLGITTLAARSGVRIGITIGIHSEAESLWINGIKQNALFLAKLFKHSVRSHSVVLVNTTQVPITQRLPWDRSKFPTERFDDVKDRLDILIELGGQISETQTAYLKSRGARLVSYCCGPEYVQTMESIIFGRRLFDSLFVNTRYDEVWVIPQVAETTFHYLKTLRRRPTIRVPFVWDPIALEQRSAHLPNRGEYRPCADPCQPRRLSIMEPNIDVMKFCFYPMLIAENAYRIRPDLIAHLHVTNSTWLAENSPEFVALARQLDLVRDRKASFVGRFDTPQFLGEFSDIVISHQWGLALNYFYFDVCWQGYPLVHNANLCMELGYFYPENEIELGAERVVEALTTHDTQWERYRDKQRRLIERFLSSSPPLIAHYDELLDNVLAQPLSV